jgi:hypothetical protein
MELALSVILVGDDAVVLFGPACAPGLGPVVVLPIGCFAIRDGVHALLAHMLRVLADHGDKRTARLALVLGHLKCQSQVRCFLADDLSVWVGPVDFEHAELSGGGAAYRCNCSGHAAPHFPMASVCTQKLQI